MKRIFDLSKVAWSERRVLYNFDLRRGVHFQKSLNWIRPEKVKIYQPARSGDLATMPKYFDSPMLDFRDSEELKTADEKVKKVLSLGYQDLKHNFLAYEHELVQKVQNHSYDTNSTEVKIAKFTAKIRYYQDYILKKPTKFAFKRRHIEKLIGRRAKYLKLLREEDYRKFEWLLDTLNLEYKPHPIPDEKVTRKKSLMLLAKLKVERAKEEKLAALKQSLDKQKVPFLEKKIAKLREIKEKEEKFNLPLSVTQEEIDDCVKRLEEVKIEVAEREKWGYKRKIHPYFLEPFNEKLLRENEKAAEVIRERIQLGRQNECSS